MRNHRPGDVKLLHPNNFEEADEDSTFVLKSLYYRLPKCWALQPDDRPSTDTLLFKIFNLSAWAVSTATRNEDISGNGLKEAYTASGATFKSPPGGHHEEGAQDISSVDASDDPPSENVLKRKRAGSRSSGDTLGDEYDRKVRARVEYGSDGGMRDKEDEEKEEVRD